MKTMITLISLSTILLCLEASAQTQPQAGGSGLAERFQQLDRNGDRQLSREEAGSAPFFKAADNDGDGFVTLSEAEAHARQSAAPARNHTAGMEGDGAGPMTSRVKPVEILETESPIQTLDAKTADGRAVRAFWRKPKGAGPFPAIVFIHGGLTQFPEEVLRRQLTVNPVITRMLAAGCAVVQATFRTYEQDVQSRGPIEDVRAVVQTLAKTSEIDGQRLALFGGSGGGSIALELGGDPAVRAIIAGEPATVLYTGMLTTGDYASRLEIMAAPEKHLTPELRQRTLQKLASLRAPVLILHSDQHDLQKLNKPLFLPLMKQAGVKVEYREYPGYGHGFYFGGGDDRWGRGADEPVVEAVVRDVRAFLDNSMPSAATPRSAAGAPAWVTPAVTAPRVQFRTFPSAAAKTKVSYHLYAPAIYHEEPERVPHIDATFRTVASREGRIIEGFSMGGYGAARLGLKYPEFFGAVSVLAGGPLDLEFHGPRAAANPGGRERILKDAFGGDMGYYKAQSPMTVAELNAANVRGKVFIRQVVGSRDFSAALNRAFSAHLEKLNIEHTFTEVPGVSHDAMALLRGLGEKNWEFYRSALGDKPAAREDARPQ